MLIRKAFGTVVLGIGVAMAQNAVLNVMLDDTGAVYLNGAQIEIPGNRGSVPVTIRQGENVLGVWVKDAGYAGGFALSIDLTTCGTADTVISDGTWKVSDEAPNGWNTSSFDASGWLPVGAYGVLADDTTQPRHTLNGHKAQWLWTPPKVYMRKSFSANTAGTYSVGIQGNGFAYKIYLNGTLIAQQSEMQLASNPTDIIANAASVVAGENVMAIEATCLDSVNMAYLRAGLFSGAGAQTTRLVVTDSTWKYSFTEVSGWNNTGFDDSEWKFIQTKKGASTGGPFSTYQFVWPSNMYFRLSFTVPVAGVRQAATTSRVHREHWADRAYYTLDGQRLGHGASEIGTGVVIERAVTADRKTELHMIHSR